MECRTICLNGPADSRETERAIDRAISDCGLTVTLRASLRKFPGCIHWHLKRGREAGTLEVTFWPKEHRAWFTIQGARKAAWIEVELPLLDNAIQRQLGSR